MLSQSLLGLLTCNSLGLVDMFLGATADDAKADILSSFRDGHLCSNLYQCFWHGNFCKSVEQVYHWGPLDDFELYVQEIGQAGRDDRQCTATLFVSDAETKGDFDHYCYSQECRCLTLERLFQVDKLLVTPACFCCGSCEQA